MDLDGEQESAEHSAQAAEPGFTFQEPEETKSPIQATEVAALQPVQTPARICGIVTSRIPRWLFAELPLTTRDPDFREDDVIRDVCSRALISASWSDDMIPAVKTRWAAWLTIAGVLVVVAAAFVQITSGQSPAVMVLTQHNDNSRTGANLSETALNTSNVNAGQFGKLFTRAVDGQTYAQPLYLPGVNMGARGIRNVVFVATEKNNVYAFDADDPAASAPLWQVNLGPPVPVRFIGETLDINEYIGITSTPVIDPVTRTLYCLAKTKESGKYPQRLHDLDISTGQEKFGGPVVLDGRGP